MLGAVLVLVLAFGVGVVVGVGIVVAVGSVGGGVGGACVGRAVRIPWEDGELSVFGWC